MADFTNVSVALDADGKTIDLSGQSTVEVTQPVEVTTVVKALADGSTHTFQTEGSETTTVASPTVIDSCSDSAGRNYTISPDGQRATP